LGSSELNAVVTFHSYPWTSAWHSRGVRFDANGCTWDGDDCRASRCCSKAGSSCYVKSSRWASCNETCSVNKKWGAGRNGHGVWMVTSYPVWSCQDITIRAAAPEVQTTGILVSTAPVTTDAQTDAQTTSMLVSTAPVTTDAPVVFESTKQTPETTSLAPETSKQAADTTVVEVVVLPEADAPTIASTAAPAVYSMAVEAAPQEPETVQYPRPGDVTPPAPIVSLPSSSDDGTAPANVKFVSP